MDVCKNCFQDKELKAFISSSNRKGKCHVCNSGNIEVISIKELQDFFQELVSNFRISGNGKSFISIIQEHWSFFSSEDNGKNILNNILPELKTEIGSSNTTVDFNLDIIESYEYWEVLKEELKWSRRFILNIDYLTQELGWDGFFNTQFQLKKSNPLFRARVHHKSGSPPYQVHEMNCPEPVQTSGGRANPMGIPYLYLSNNEKTTLYEVRASYLDEISVGTFHLNSNEEEIKIVDFTEEPALYFPSRINEIIKAHLLKRKISADLSKPMRRYDSEIEYIPTQFICEFIKVITGASGIQFMSSLDPNGKNIVIFDQALMQCTSVKLVKVSHLNLDSIEVKYDRDSEG